MKLIFISLKVLDTPCSVRAPPVLKSSAYAPPVRRSRDYTTRSSGYSSLSYVMADRQKEIYKDFVATLKRESDPKGECILGDWNPQRKRKFDLFWICKD